MRISDRFLLNEYIRNMNQTKTDMSRLQEGISTGKTINKPSDSPLGTSRIMRLSSQMKNVSTYSSNIDQGSAQINGAIQSMSGIQTEVEKIMANLTALQNPTLGSDYNTMAKTIDSSISQILDLANSKFNGQFLFGGTDNSTKPYSVNSGTNTVDILSKAVGGEKKIRISQNIDQKINMTGKELFQSVLAQDGTLDSADAIGATSSTNKTVYDADGNQYTFAITYKKTAANTYDLTYTIDDGSGSGPQAVGGTNTLAFDSTTNEINSLDGGTLKDIKIQAVSNKVDFAIDLSGLKEGSSNSVSSTLSQKANIFNTLLSIKNSLLGGNLPNQNQVNVVNEFNQHIINKLSIAGEISNRLTSTKQLLDNQTLELTNLKSQENDVDIVKSMMDLQSKQLNLQTGYKISAMILPKSLVDFL